MREVKELIGSFAGVGAINARVVVATANAVPLATVGLLGLDVAAAEARTLAGLIVAASDRALALAARESSTVDPVLVRNIAEFQAWSKTTHEEMDTLAKALDARSADLDKREAVVAAEEAKLAAAVAVDPVVAEPPPIKG